jgi:hypothetical protein
LLEGVVDRARELGRDRTEDAASRITNFFDAVCVVAFGRLW